MKKKDQLIRARMEERDRARRIAAEERRMAEENRMAEERRLEELAEKKAARKRQRK